MDHYEELGLPRSASLDEIRQAYRRVARLLHPDRCADEESRRLADLQMKRLNGILAVLTDPATRSVYDKRLLAGAPAAEPPGGVRQWFWPVAAAIVLLSFLWAIPRRPVTHILTQPAAEPPRVATPPIARPSRGRRISHAPRRPSPLPPPPLAPALAAAPLPSPPEAAIAIPAMPRILTPAPELPPPAGLAGEWLYVPPPHARNDGLYPPEYIELRVAEEAGVLSGSYRARYRVSDQAISPSVAFRFRGRAGAHGGSLPWIGAGGARGKLTLRPLANGALEVTWVADYLGAELGLVSGTATLVRKLE